MKDETQSDTAPIQKLAGLEVVEVEVGSRCNRRCTYCPVSLDPTPPVPRLMPDNVFFTLIEQLAQHGFGGRISYHLYNEPLLRADLTELVELVDRKLPEALQILNTNGDLLNDKRYSQLRRAGIDYFFVTRHSTGIFPDRPFQIVQYWTELSLTNRGGTLKDLPGPSTSARKTPCFAPSEMLIVTVTGDVLLCYEDAARTHIMGNVLQTSLAEIWTASHFELFRSRLAQGDRALDPMCSACSNVSHCQPGLSALEDPVLTSTRTHRSPSVIEELKRRSRTARDTSG